MLRLKTIANNGAFQASFFLLMLHLSSAALANANKIEFPSQATLAYAKSGITVSLSLTGYFLVEKFNISTGENNFPIPVDACDRAGTRHGIRIEQITIAQQIDDLGAKVFHITLYGNEVIGIRKTRLGDYYEIVPTCTIFFDRSGFIKAELGEQDASRLAPPRSLQHP